MENEQITITLTVAQWQAVLGALEYAPYFIINGTATTLVELHTQAAQQMEQLQKAASETGNTNESDSVESND